MDGAARDNSGHGRRTNGNGKGRATQATRLRSWKEIAAYFGTDTRTVKRWEASHGLPVQRVPGGARTPVYADVSELERWMQRRDEPVPVAEDRAPATEAIAVARRRPAGLAVVFGLVIVLAIAAFVLVRGGGSDPAAPRHEPSQKAVDIFTAATNQAERATPESLRRAIGLYGQAIAEDPAYANAYSGLAAAYIRLRTFAAVSEQEAYPRAKAAARQALELDPNLAQAHAAMGYISFYSDWDFALGLRHFAEAARLEPQNASGRYQSGRYQYGMALLHTGNFAAALRELDAVQRADPRSRSILADRGFVLYQLGRRDEAVALLNDVVANDPDYMVAYHYLSLIHLGEGNWREGLTHAETVARLRQDADRLAQAAPARRALAQGGGEAMLRTVLAGKLRLHAAGREPAYVLAETYALLGERDAALRYLNQSIAAREPLALTLRIDPLLRNLHGDSEFQRLAQQVGQPR